MVLNEECLAIIQLCRKVTVLFVSRDNSKRIRATNNWQACAIALREWLRRTREFSYAGSVRFFPGTPLSFGEESLFSLLAPLVACAGSRGFGSLRCHPTGRIADQLR